MGPMKPEFALDLTPERLVLLQRAERGWQVIGEAALEWSGLKRRLAKLREAAEAAAPGKLRSKVILPDSQVLYTSIECPGEAESERRAAIRAALDGMTPYKLDDLIFDWEAEGETLHVAVVARETLAEAEEFAAEHGFSPVSIVARPKGGSFTGEPFFGETKAAGELLPKGARVVRDILPTTATLRLTETVAAAAAGSAAGTAPETAARAAPEALDAADEALVRALGEAPPAAAPNPESKDEGAAAAPPAAGGLPEAGTPEAAGPAREVGSDSASPSLEPSAEASPAVTVAAPDPVAKAAPSPKALSGAGHPTRKVGPAQPPAANAGGYTARTSASAPSRTASEREAELALAQALAAPAGPASGAKPSSAPGPAPGPGPGDSGGALRLGAAGPIRVTAGDLPPIAPAPERPAAAGSSIQRRREARGAAVAAPRAPAAWRRVLARPKPLRESPAADDPLSGFTALAEPLPASRVSLTALVALAGTAAFAAAILIWLVLIGDTEPAGVPQDPVPQVALAPTEAAAPAQPSVAAAVPAPAQPALAEAPAESDLAPALQPGTEPVVEPAPILAPESAAAAPADAAADPAAEPGPAADVTASLSTATEPAPGPGTEAAAQAGDADLAVAYAATGIWSRAPEPPAGVGSEPLDAMVTDAIDARLPAPPQPPSARGAAPDLPPVAQPAPPLASGVRLDTRGLVAATPEGAVTPSGTVVYLGRPPVVPAGRPLSAAVAPAPADAPDAAPGNAADAAAEPVAEDAPFALPGTPSTRPRPRPAGFVDAAIATPGPEVGLPDTADIEAAVAAALGVGPAAAPPAADTAAPAGADSGAGDAAIPEAAAEAAPDTAAPDTAPPVSDPALAGFRPRPRPAAAGAPAGLPGTDADVAVLDAAAAAAAAAAEAVAATPPASFPGSSDLAVATALVPRARPAGHAARAVAARPPPVVADDPEAEADGEAETAAAAAAAAASAPAGGPRIPTRASVAEQATLENAIRLNRVNLIGIYGSSSDRRALVRLPSGRYVKVQVGDRVDGGQVAAISDSELRYVKNGRNIVLTIARGG